MRLPEYPSEFLRVTNPRPGESLFDQLMKKATSVEVIQISSLDKPENLKISQGQLACSEEVSPTPSQGVPDEAI